jgi:hypothetical protein
MEWHVQYHDGIAERVDWFWTPEQAIDAVCHQINETAHPLFEDEPRFNTILTLRYPAPS